MVDLITKHNSVRAGEVPGPLYFFAVERGRGRAAIQNCFFPRRIDLFVPVRRDGGFANGLKSKRII